MGHELIAIDWGTTSLRAYRIDAQARVLAEHKSEHGIQVHQGVFEATLEEVLALVAAQQGTPVLMAGMIGSRQGWVEAPYIETPCSVDSLAQRLTEVPTRSGRTVKIVPGLCDLSGPAPDVMRGEETKLLGLLGARQQAYETICMPGTHCKWATAKEGRILGFKTYMTGELFGLLCEHSILGRLMPPESPDDWEAFDLGVKNAGDPDHLLHHLFSVRTLGLFDRVQDAGLESYLSGLLIGHEIRAAAKHAKGTIALLGDARLTLRYERAFDRLGLACVRPGENIVVAGLAVIARTAGLL